MGKKHKKHHKSDRRSEFGDDDGNMKEEAQEPNDKSLKLVFKIGNQSTPQSEDGNRGVDDNYEGERKEKKHKHKKKKKKKEKERLKLEERERKEKRQRETGAYDESSIDTFSGTQADLDEPPSKKQFITNDENSCSRLESKESFPEPDVKADDLGTLFACLDYLLRSLQKKDIELFFASPVNDIIAPGYSSIILHPMDFSTMKAKIDKGKYRSVMDFKRDFVLMCHNAMTYNMPETIYHKAAKKMLQSGNKLLSKDKLLSMRRNLSFMATLTIEQLGIFDEEQIMSDVENPPIFAPEIKNSKDSMSTSALDTCKDEMTPEEILAQAKSAAKHARDQLTLRKPNSKFGFLRRREDGSTTMTFLNPDNDGILNEKERVINLGSLIGKLTTGTGTLAGFKEDKRNIVKPINYLNYGVYSSYAPSYDSSFSNLSKEHSDLVLSCYGDEKSVEYAQSLLDYVADSSEFAIKIVDDLLDTLTDGEHSKTKKILEDEGKENIVKSGEESKGKKDSEESKKPSEPVKIDFDSLRSLSELGIDTSFLPEYEKRAKVKGESTDIQSKLDETSNLIFDLQKEQHERLSRTPPAHLAHVQGPSQSEITLADKVTRGLTDLARQTTPAELVSTSTVRKIIGISNSPDDPISVDSPDVQITHLSDEEAAKDDTVGDVQNIISRGPSLHVSQSPTNMDIVQSDDNS